MRKNACQELAELSSNSTHIIIPDSSHLLPLEKPQSVVDAILQALEEAENK